MICKECEKEVRETIGDVCLWCLHKAYEKLKQLITSEELNKLFKE